MSKITLFLVMAFFITGILGFASAAELGVMCQNHPGPDFCPGGINDTIAIGKYSNDCTIWGCLSNATNSSAVLVNNTNLSNIKAPTDNSSNEEQITTENNLSSKENRGCAEAGDEGDVHGKHCCSGLTSVQINKEPVNGNCLEEYPPYGTQFLCINCGNNLCEDKENKCNCPEDCSGEKIKIGKEEIETELEIEEGKENNQSKLKVNLSNGRKAEIKIMPETASERAIERLGQLNFTIQLKEVGQGNQTRLAYQLQAERHYKLLWLFKVKAQVKAEVDAETGELISTKKPWWAFLAREIEE